MASDSTDSNLFHLSVCKRIENRGKLYAAMRAGGKATFDDKKYWREPSEMLTEASMREQKVPVIFATDDDRDYAFGWAILTSAELKGAKQYSFANLVEFRNPVHFDDLQKRDQGHGTRIGARQTTSRPYNIIHTPYDLLKEVPSSLETINTDSKPKDIPSEASSSVSAQPPPPSTQPSDATNNGAGFGDPEQNRKVEKAVVDFVIETYEGQGFDVERRESQNLGYDLFAIRGSEEWHVEVKGVSGNAPEFPITANEVRCAREDQKWRIAIVVNALEDGRTMIEINADDFLQQYDLRPLSYRAVRKR